MYMYYSPLFASLSTGNELGRDELMKAVGYLGLGLDGTLPSSIALSLSLTLPLSSLTNMLCFALTIEACECLALPLLSGSESR